MRLSGCVKELADNFAFSADAWFLVMDVPPFDGSGYLDTAQSGFGSP
jgi:hypothetical protein